MKQTYLIKTLLSLMLLFVGSNVWGLEVTYKISTKTSVTSTDALAGSTATYSTTYTSLNQLIKGKSMTLTLAGYSGYKITGLKLKMKSNTSSGSGYLSMTAGETTLATIGGSTNGVAFNKFGDSNAYSIIYKNVNITLSNTSYVIGSGEVLTIVVGATANSIYVDSYTLTYELDDLKPVTSLAIAGTPHLVYNKGESFDYSALNVTATFNDGTIGDITGLVTWEVTPTVFETHGNQNVQVQATYKSVSDIKEYNVKVYDMTTIDLSTNSYVSRSTQKVIWVCDAAKMIVDKAGASTDADNYLGGMQYSSSRFYKNSTLTIEPVRGVKILSIVYDAPTSNYASVFASSTFTNATVTSSTGTTSIITPTDPTQAVVATISNTTGAKSIKIVYDYDYKRIVTTGNFGTICLPNEVNATNVSGATFYSIAGVTKEGSEVAGIVLEEETGSLVAGKPYIFKATGNAIIASYTGDAVTSAVSATGLIGNLSAVKVNVADGNYVIVNDKLRKVDGGTATIATNRAYITLDGVAEYALGNAKMMIFTEDTPTDISSLKFERGIDVPVYNLQGQRVNSSVEGILIIGGKKQYVK